MTDNLGCFPYLDRDVAYLVGLVLGRGRFKNGTDITELVISDVSITATDQSRGMRTRLPVCGINLPRLRRRLHQLVQTDPVFVQDKSRFRICLALGTRGLALKNLYLLTGKSTRRSSLRIHHSIMNASKSLRRELLNGLVAASGQLTFQRSAHNLRLLMRSSNLARQVIQLLGSTVGVSVAESRKKKVLLIQSKELPKLSSLHTLVGTTLESGDSEPIR